MPRQPTRRSDTSRNHPRPTPGPARSDVAPETDPAVDERKAAILNAVVSEYIDSALPVGSAHVTGIPGVEVSSATVRSDMAALERDGYLTQPHTSAGRIPTDKGYRFFVDHLSAPGTLGPDQKIAVRQFFRHMHGEVEDLLGRTSGFLADLTDYAAVVVIPAHEKATVRSTQLVHLGSNIGLLVVVLSDGSVEKRTFELSPDTDEETLTAAAAKMTLLLRDMPLTDAGGVALSLGPPMSAGGKPSADRPMAGDLASRVSKCLADIAAPEEPDHVFVGGSSRMAAAFDAVDTVRSVLAILEQQLVVVELIEQILDSGLSVAIGSEHGFEPLASCALVVAPVSIEGEPVGTIGVVGPTRMHYPRALAAVRVVGEQLSERLAPSPRRAGSEEQRGD